MKVSISNKKLLEALAIVASVAEKKQVMPILSHLYFSVKNNRITFIGSDTEVEVTFHLQLEGDSPDMEGTIPARKFLNICRSFPADGVVDINYDSGNFRISCTTSSFELSSLPPEDFPIMEMPADEDRKIKFSIEKDILVKHLTSVVSCMARNDVRFYLNGVLFDFSNKGLSLVATDGHRLAIAKHNTPQLSQEDIKCIVPHKGVNEMMRLINNFEDKVELVFYSNFLQMAGDTFSYSCKLIDAPFPDYNRVIPADSKHEVIAEINGLRAGLKRCAILGQDSGEKHHRVELGLGDNNIHIFSTNKNEEKMNDDLAVEYQGEDMTIKFNVFYLLDILNVLRDGDISFNLTDANSSALLHKQDDKDTQFVVMPMKI